MIYLLDTNTCIVFLNQASSQVRARLSQIRRDEVALCNIVKAELYFGAYKSLRKEQNLAVLKRFFAGFPILDFDEQAAECYGRIRTELEEKGQPIGPYDLQIAAIALRHGATLVTHNVREFTRVTGLLFEDWQAIT
jgi:tRNA(fMet)-specific endonuclease VapC